MKGSEIKVWDSDNIGSLDLGIYYSKNMWKQIIRNDDNIEVINWLI